MIPFSIISSSRVSAGEGVPSDIREITIRITCSDVELLELVSDFYPRLVCYREWVSLRKLIQDHVPQEILLTDQSSIVRAIGENK